MRTRLRRRRDAGWGTRLDDDGGRRGRKGKFDLQSISDEIVGSRRCCFDTENTGIEVDSQPR